MSAMVDITGKQKQSPQHPARLIVDTLGQTKATSSAHAALPRRGPDGTAAVSVELWP